MENRNIISFIVSLQCPTCVLIGCVGSVIVIGKHNIKNQYPNISASISWVSLIVLRCVHTSCLITLPSHPFLLSSWSHPEVDWLQGIPSWPFNVFLFFPYFLFQSFCLPGISSSNPFIGVVSMVIKCLTCESPLLFFITYFIEQYSLLSGCSMLFPPLKIFIIVSVVCLFSPVYFI